MKNLVDYRISPIFANHPVSGTQISPDGTRVLFTYMTVNMEENKYDSHIWVKSLKEKQPKQFTHSKGNDANPMWSPDGNSILFLSNRLSEEDKVGEEKKRMRQLFVIPSDGGEARRLTSIEAGVNRPSWSPDGSTILFLSSVFKGERVEGSDVKIIRHIRYKNYEGDFTHGKRAHLFSVPSKGGKVKQLTDGDFNVNAAVWSSDGSRIAFVSNLEEDGDLSHFNNIYTIPSKGGDPELLWKGKGRIGALGWSPDGKYLAFSGRVVEDPSLIFYKNTELWVLPLEGGEPEILTADFDRTVLAGTGPPGLTGILWSPDSEYIYFKIPDLGGANLCRVSLQGEAERVTDEKMTLGGFSLDATGSIIALNATDIMTPSELWIKDEKGTRRLTEMDNGLLKKLTLVEPEEFWFTASDGVNVQGWIIKPHDFKEGEKYPTITYVHGGPRAFYGYQMTPAEHEFQVLVDHDFAVMYTNPRGSTGFGESFAAEISGHRGERDYLDIMDAVDYVIETYPFVDSDRLGIAGGSYGGFMTNWIVGHTDRFKAAVSMRSTTNMYSRYGTSDGGWRGHDVSWGKDPWDNLEAIMEKSPITYVKNIKTPLLLIHCEQDWRCPIEQAEQLFTALKKLERVVEFVRFPDESHSVSRSGQPKHRVERLQHIVRWFDRYLR